MSEPTYLGRPCSQWVDELMELYDEALKKQHKWVEENLPPVWRDEDAASRWRELHATYDWLGL